VGVEVMHGALRLQRGLQAPLRKDLMSKQRLPAGQGERVKCHTPAICASGGDVSLVADVAFLRLCLRLLLCAAFGRVMCGDAASAQ
jgi:hypothetical protein